MVPLIGNSWRALMELQEFDVLEQSIVHLIDELKASKEESARQRAELKGIKAQHETSTRALEDKIAALEEEAVTLRREKNAAEQQRNSVKKRLEDIVGKIEGAKESIDASSKEKDYKFTQIETVVEQPKQEAPKQVPVAAVAVEPEKPAKVEPPVEKAAEKVIVIEEKPLVEKAAPVVASAAAAVDAVKEEKTLKVKKDKPVETAVMKESAPAAKTDIRTMTPDEVVTVKDDEDPFSSAADEEWEKLEKATAPAKDASVPAVAAAAAIDDDDDYLIDNEDDDSDSFWKDEQKA